MICGVDEAGRGPVIGPLVIAAVCIENDTELINIDVKDSKKISSRKRFNLSEKIKKISSTYEVIVIPASDIDEMRNIMTLNEIEVNAFAKVIKKLKPDICYVDAADVNADRFGKDILSRLSFEPKIISKHKADDIYPIVSAASIIAKTKRDHEVKKINQELRKYMNIDLGSGYPADPVTKTFLKKWISKYGELPSHTRHSWKTSQNLLNDFKTKKLDI